MAEALIVCGGLPPPKRRKTATIRLDASLDADPAQRIEIRFDRHIKRLVDNPPAALVDLLEVASYVYVADRLVAREPPTMPRMGARWRRRFHFHIPVRRPDIWSRAEVTKTLIETLAFLSEDSFTFTFEQSAENIGLEPYLGFDDPEAQKFRPEEVALFSGGLDSLSGAVDLVMGSKTKTVLVAHQSATSIAHRQNAAAETLRAKATPASLLYMPVWVRKGDQEPIEHTQRLRSFLFTALGILVARLHGLSRLLVFENGVTSFNLPVAEHVLGTRASRTTHPRVLNDLGKLASLLLGQAFSIENPLLWKTKAEVVATLSANACGEMIAQTTSCANVRFLSMHGRQCGFCSQCVERRLALLAAGLSHHEGPDAYALDLFRGPYTTANQSAMAKLHFLRARRFASLTDVSFAASFGQVFRSISSLPGTGAENLSRIRDLHQRYGHSVLEVVDREFAAAATLEAAVVGNDESLLSVLTRREAAQALPDATEVEPAPSLQDGPETGVRIAILIAINTENNRVEFDWGIAFGGRGYDLLRVLAEQFRLDQQEGKEREAFRYLPGRQVAERLATNDSALRRIVLRTRRRLADVFRASVEYEIDDEDIIQSLNWRGYRINPYVVLVDSSQLRKASPGSRHVSNQRASRTAD